MYITLGSFEDCTKAVISFLCFFLSYSTVTHQRCVSVESSLLRTTVTINPVSDNMTRFARSFIKYHLNIYHVFVVGDRMVETPCEGLFAVSEHSASRSFSDARTYTSLKKQPEFFFHEERCDQLETSFFVNFLKQFMANFVVELINLMNKRR